MTILIIGFKQADDSPETGGVCKTWTTCDIETRNPVRVLDFFLFTVSFMWNNVAMGGQSDSDG